MLKTNVVFLKLKTGILYIYIMKGLHFLWLAVFLGACSMPENTQVLATNIIAEQECPPEGSATRADLKELNKLKNRQGVPAAGSIDTAITLKKILQPGNDKSRWSTSKAARITGYVYDVKPGGVESCNCKTEEKDRRDTHIELVADPMHTGKTLRMVVEITPHMREAEKKKNVDWSTETLRSKLLGRWVTFTGWLLFDAEHASQAENTSPGRARNWRATAWEIHPVTNIEVTNKN